MLTIIKALDKWDTELQSVKEFSIITDYRNLEYFMSTRKLTEQQMCWANTLSKYNFKILYTPGKSNTIPDLLSHHPQDVPSSCDKQLQACECQLLKPGMCTPGVFCTKPTVSLVQAVPTNTEREGEEEVSAIELLWTEWLEKDQVLQQILQAVREGRRTFPPELRLKVSIGECEVQEGQVLFGDHTWVSDSKPLRTWLIQLAHDSPLTEHPGQDRTVAILWQDYFWPNMDADVEHFVLVTVLALLHIWHKSHTLPGSSICTVACLLRRCLIPCL